MKFLGFGRDLAHGLGRYNYILELYVAICSTLRTADQGSNADYNCMLALWLYVILKSMLWLSVV